MINKNLPVFPGVQKPSSDFPSVRSELRAPPMYRDIDLSVARSLANGSAETLTLVGNVIYIDQKGASGYAVIHVQDDASVGNTPITVFPGFLARLPFTQIILENVAQPGQVLRIIYGTDMDFIPVPGGGVSVLNAININDIINPTCQFISTGGAAGVGFTVTPMLLPAANPRGTIVRHAYISHAAGAGGVVSTTLFAAAAAPVGVASQAAQLTILSSSNSTTARVLVQTDALNRLIPAGWGLYQTDNVTVAAANSGCNTSVEVL